MVIADGSGTDFLTVDDSVVTGSTLPSGACPLDRADVASLKAIVNQLITEQPAIFGASADGLKTGRERALDMLDAFETAITDDANYAGQTSEIAELIGAGITDVTNAAETDPAFELFSFVIGTLDDVNVANGDNTVFPQATIDPVVSYDSTSLLNMPKSSFDEMIELIQPLVSGAPDIASLKNSYQTLVNENGNIAPSKQIFWDFLAHSDSPGIFSYH